MTSDVTQKQRITSDVTQKMTNDVTQKPPMTRHNSPHSVLIVVRYGAGEIQCKHCQVHAIQ